MIRLKTDLKLKSRVVMKCDRHSRYNPEKDGPGAIRGTCRTCTEMWEVYNSHVKLLEALKSWEWRSKPFETLKPRGPRVKVTTPSPELTKAFEILLPKSS